VNIAFAIVFGWVFAEKEATEMRERLMEERLRQSRSRALQSQLEPHVLYNALNGLSELVHEDPPAAEEMIARLADLYRMLTTHGEAESVPLMKERILVEAYLSMEEMRLGSRLEAAWDWPPWADSVVLPPLFLQPLAENAVKHGISPCDAGGRLRLVCAREGGRVVLSVANTGHPLASDARMGVGLGNLRARLELWKEGQGTFSLTQEGEWTVARIGWRLP
jgi:LytS/YehU family sensor histidine kinase